MENQSLYPKGIIVDLGIWRFKAYLKPCLYVERNINPTAEPEVQGFH